MAERRVPVRGCGCRAGAVTAALCPFMGAVPLRQPAFVRWMEHIAAQALCLLAKSAEQPLNKEINGSFPRVALLFTAEHNGPLLLGAL